MADAISARDTSNKAVEPGTQRHDAELKLPSLLERACEATPTSAPREARMPAGALAVATVVGFHGELPTLLIANDRFNWLGVAVAVTGDFDPVRSLGSEVCVAFENGELDRPIVLGTLLARTTKSTLGKGVQISDEREIVLKCGKSSMTLRADGTVSIRGTNVATRASHTNRIRGGNVQIN